MPRRPSKQPSLSNGHRTFRRSCVFLQRCAGCFSPAKRLKPAFRTSWTFAFQGPVSVGDSKTWLTGRKNTAGNWTHHGLVDKDRRDSLGVPVNFVRFYFMEEKDAEAFLQAWPTEDSPP
jgi:hypothetical protein